MTRQLKNSFNPLPRRSYDLNIYSSYPCSVMDKRRETAPTWHCFAVYDDEILKLILAILEQYNECECYCKPIYEDEFIYEKGEIVEYV